MDIFPIRSIEETEKTWVAWAHEIYTKGTGIRWGIFYGNRIIGTSGYHNISLVGEKKIDEIGYDLMVKYWGKGFISEVLPTVLEFSFSTLLIDEVHTLIVPENVRSKKLIEKNGFSYRKTVKLHPPCKDKFQTKELYIYSKDFNS